MTFYRHFLTLDVMVTDFGFKQLYHLVSQNDRKNSIYFMQHERLSQLLFDERWKAKFY